MTIAAKIIADSVGVHSPRLTTFQLRYPRFIHAELMTHRVFSRNASSSRAVPVKRIIADILDDTAMPIHWGKNQKGMQADEENDAPVQYPIYVQQPMVLPTGAVPDSADRLSITPTFERWTTSDTTAEEAWLHARDRAIEMAQAFDAAGYHKQIVNRLLEPFAHISVVVTATDYDNFYWLRQHKDAMPEIKFLADGMRDLMNASVPQVLQPSEWHLPYITDRDFQMTHGKFAYYKADERIDPWTLELIKCSAARCARVSYLTHDGDSPSIEADLALYERLVGGERLHVSPVEHQATPDSYKDYVFDGNVWCEPKLSGNLDPGWIQYRKLVPGERYRYHREVA